MGIFQDELTSWFDEMHALAPVAVVYLGVNIRAVQDEDQAQEILLPGGRQATIEGYIIVMKSDFDFAPKSQSKITVEGNETRILSVHTEPTDPTYRISYGKL